MLPHVFREEPGGLAFVKLARPILLEAAQSAGQFRLPKISPSRYNFPSRRKIRRLSGNGDRSPVLLQQLLCPMRDRESIGCQLSCRFDDSAQVNFPEPYFFNANAIPATVPGTPAAR